MTGKGGMTNIRNPASTTSGAKIGAKLLHSSFDSLECGAVAAVLKKKKKPTNGPQKQGKERGADMSELSRKAKKH